MPEYICLTCLVPLTGLPDGTFPAGPSCQESYCEFCLERKNGRYKKCNLCCDKMILIEAGSCYEKFVCENCSQLPRIEMKIACNWCDSIIGFPGETSYNIYKRSIRYEIWSTENLPTWLPETARPEERKPEFTIKNLHPPRSDKTFEKKHKKRKFTI